MRDRPHILDGHLSPAPDPIVPGCGLADKVVALGEGTVDTPRGARVAAAPSR